MEGSEHCPVFEANLFRPRLCRNCMQAHAPHDVEERATASAGASEASVWRERAESRAEEEVEREKARVEKSMGPRRARTASILLSEEGENEDDADGCSAFETFRLVADTTVPEAPPLPALAEDTERGLAATDSGGGREASDVSAEKTPSKRKGSSLASGGMFRRNVLSREGLDLWRDNNSLRGVSRRKTYEVQTAKMKALRSTLKTLQGSRPSNPITDVAVPRGLDKLDWLAANTVDFFNEISLLYCAAGDFCTPESCPVMSAGKKVQYYWADGVKVKKPVQVSAPEYVDLITTWVETQLADEDLFPSDIYARYPRNFEAVVQRIFKRMFRVYAHIYHTHFEQMFKLGAEAHLNTSFKHFVFFFNEFGLVDQKEQYPLKELVERFLADTEPNGSKAGGAGGKPAVDESGHEAKW